MDETLEMLDGRTVLRMSRRFAHSREKVWRAITDAAHLREWFPASVDLRLEVGAPLTFVFPDGQAPDQRGEVVEVDPPRVLAFRWDTDLLRFELVGTDTGCELRFTHTFDDRAGAASFATGWTVCFAALDQQLDGEPIEPPEWTARAHEAFHAEFGLPSGSAQRDADGWRVRFERQTPVPVEKVEEALASGGFRDDPAARWECSPGPGGARIVLDATERDDPETALVTWHLRLEELVGTVTGYDAAPDEQTLRERYAAQVRA